MTKPDASNLKKRKLLAATVEDLSLPAPKQLCCEVVVRSEGDSVVLKAVDEVDGEVLDMLAESAQDSNSFLGDSQSAANEASSSCANSGAATSGNYSLSLESRVLQANGDGMEELELAQDISEWHNVDCLEECNNTNSCKDKKQQVAGQLEGFLSSSGVNANLFMLSSEAQMGRHKPTIDQEFEQYFSMLML